MLTKNNNSRFIATIFIGLLLSCFFVETTFAGRCQDLYSADNYDTINSIINELATFSDDDSKDKTQNLDTTDVLYFTNRSNLYRVPYCGPQTRTAGKRTDRAGLYPIGLIFKPLLRYSTNDNGDYVYGVTEHGLHVLIQEKDLTPLEKGKIYLFNQGSENIPYCTGESACVKNLFVESFYDERVAEGTVLNPKLRYAIVNNYSSNDIEQIINCKEQFSLKLDLYDAGHQPLNEKKRYITNCIKKKDESTNKDKLLPNSSLKVASYSEWNKKINTGFRGSYLKIETNLKHQIADNLGTMFDKGCLNNSKYEQACTIKSIERILDDTFKCGIRRCITDIIKRLYLNKRHASFVDFTLDQEEEPLKLNYEKRLYTVAKCEEGKPTEARDIIITDDRFNQDYLTIEVYSKDNDHNQINKTANSIITNFKAFKFSGYRPVTDPDLLEQGFFWKITDPYEYFLWKQIIKSIILNNYKLRDFSKSEGESISLFLTELILSTVFYYPSND